MADCSYYRCIQERRFVKRELQKWNKDMVYIVGEYPKPLLSNHSPKPLRTSHYSSNKEMRKLEKLSQPNTNEPHSPCPIFLSPTHQASEKCIKLFILSTKHPNVHPNAACCFSNYLKHLHLFLAFGALRLTLGCLSLLMSFCKQQQRPVAENVGMSSVNTGKPPSSLLKIYSVLLTLPAVCLAIV